MQSEETLASLTRIERGVIEKSLRDGYVTRWRNGGEAVLPFFHDDAVARVVGNARLLPYAGHWRGKPQIREMFRRLDTEFTFGTPTIHEMVIEGNKAMARWSGDVRARGTGVEGMIEGITRFILEHGLIVDLYEIYDTEALARFSDGRTPLDI